MSKSWKVFLTRLQTPSNHSILTNSLSKKNNLLQYPMSPTLAKEHLSEEDYQNYMAMRTHLLNKKNSTEIIDERLRPYQNQDVHFLSSIPIKGVFNQQRTGKTPTTLVTLRVRNEINNIIVVPGSTVYNWFNEYQKWHGGPVHIVKGTPARRKKLYKEEEGTFIITPKTLTNDIDILLKMKFDAIVLDEAHLMRNFKGVQSKQSSAQSKALVRLSRKIQNRYALTGTPTPNTQSDLIGILCFLFPDLFVSFWGALEYYFSTSPKIIGKTFNRSTMQMELKTVQEVVGFQSPSKELEYLEFIETISTQRKRKEVMQWIPKIDIEEIGFDMLKSQRKVHDSLTEWFEYEHVICINALDVMVKQQFLCHSPQLLGFKELGPKTEYLIEYVKDYPDTPIVITSKSRRYLELLKEVLPNAVLLAGGITNQKKQEIIVDFQKGSFNILLGQLDVIKEGISLSRAEVMFFTDRSYTYTDNEQAEDRPLPTNPKDAEKKEQQKIIRLYMKNSFDEYKHEAITAKKAEADIVNNYVHYLNERRKSK